MEVNQVADRIEELYKSGLSMKKVALELGKTRREVDLHLQSLGLVKPRGGRREFVVDPVREAERRAKISETMKDVHAERKLSGEREIIAQKVSSSIKKLRDSGHYDDVDYSKSPEVRKKISESIREKHLDPNGPYVDAWNIRGKGCRYRGRFMRSWSEVRVAEMLDEELIEWLYEPERFKLEDGSSYLPDFYLPAYDTYIEVKGWMNSRSSSRIEQFRRLGHQLLVLRFDEVWTVEEIRRQAWKSMAAEGVNDGRI